MAYSSCASSTWRWASWVRAAVAKMSRMTSVRSITLTPRWPFQVPRLGGAQVVVEDDEVGLVRLDQLLQLLDLARADVGGDIDLLPLLEHAADHDEDRPSWPVRGSRPAGRRELRRGRAG